MKTADMARCALCAVMITVCAWITIPFTVPFTMQTFAVMLTLLLLGGARGSLSIIVYIALGLIGLPVFSGFQSGAGTLLGPSGGFILGFAAMGGVYLLFEKIAAKAAVSVFIPLFLGLIVLYGFGMFWFAAVFGELTPGGILSAFSLCVLPYIIPDAVKTILAVTVCRKLKKHINT